MKSSNPYPQITAALEAMEALAKVDANQKRALDTMEAANLLAAEYGLKRCPCCCDWLDAREFRDRYEEHTDECAQCCRAGRENDAAWSYGLNHDR